MKKRILLLISLVLILCGCSAEVNINISDDKITEQITINAPVENGLTKEQTYNMFRKYMPVYAKNIIVDTEPDEKVQGIEYYEKTETESNNGYIFNYKYTYKVDNYGKSHTIKDGFRSSTIQYDQAEENILLSTDSGGLLFFENYPTLTEVKINITSTYEVLETNADYENNNTYTWVLNPSTKKSVYLLLDTHKENNDPIKTPPEKEPMTGLKKILNDHPLLVALCTIALFIIFVIIASKISKKKYK